MKLLTKAKKCLALATVFALIMSCGLTGLFDVSVTASADGEDNTSGKLYVYDEYGNDITDNPIVYIENSSSAGQDTTSEITVKLVDETKDLTEGFSFSKAKDFGVSYYYTKYPGEGVHTIEAKVIFNGVKISKGSMTNPVTNEKIDTDVETPYKPGQSFFEIYSADRASYRKISVMNQEPATDVFIKFNGATVDVNDYNMQNTTIGGYRTFTDMKYYFTYELVTGSNDTVRAEVPATFFDSVEWGVFVRDDTTGELVPADSSVAEISPEGVFTPKKHGDVIVIAYFKPTQRINKKVERATTALNAGLIDAMPDFDINPLTNTISDRVNIVGEKKRKVYVPETNKDAYIKLDDNGSIIWKVDSKTGEKVTREVNYPYEVIRPHYYLDINDALYANPYLGTITTDDDGKLVGKTLGFDNIYTMPKLIKVAMILRNPADSVEIVSGPEYMDLSQGPVQLEYSAHPSKTGPEYQSGATDVFRWESSNPEIVSVNDKGVVTPHKKGTAQIRVYGEGTKTDGSPVASEPFSITVYSKALDITIDPSAVFTRVGVTQKISAIEGPAGNAPNDEIIWESSDPSKVQVIPDPYNPDSNIQTATVVGIAEGGAYIQAKAARSGTGVESNKCQVTVNARNLSKDVKITADLGEGSQVISPGSDIPLFTMNDITINASPVSNNGTTADDDITWTVIGNDELDAEGRTVYKYATIVKQESGKIQLHGIAEGEFTVMATCASTANGDGETVSRAVNVKVYKQCDSVQVVDSDKVNVATLNLAIDDVIPMYADMRIYGNYPYNHSDSVKSWVSSDSSVAEVITTDESGNPLIDEKGNLYCKVKTKKEGSTSITVKTLSGHTASAAIKVFTTSTVYLEGVSHRRDDNSPIDENNLYANLTLSNSLQGTKQMKATVRDQNNDAINAMRCTWTSSNEDVATVSQTGLITAHDVGETVITVKSGAKSESCIFTVYAPMAAVTYSDIIPYVYSPIMDSYEPRPTFMIGNHILNEGVDFVITYANNTGVGKASMTLTGEGYYKGQKSIPFTISQRSLTDNSIDVEYVEEQECTGSAVTPDIVITCLGEELTEGVDYVVKYANNIKPGTASIKINGKGNFASSLSKEFNIVCSHKKLKDITVIKRATYEEAGLEQGTCAACGEKDVQKVIPILEHTTNPAESIEFEKEAYGVEVGKEVSLTLNAVTPDPDSPATDEFRWVSDNPKIATVDGNGVVKGVAKGRTTVTVYGENDKAVATCKIGVLVKATEVVAQPSTAKTRVGVPVELKASLKPVTSNDEIVWESENPEIAEVTEIGKNGNTAIITGVSIGTTIVRAKALYSDVVSEVIVEVSDKNAADLITVSTVIGDTSAVIPDGGTAKIFSNKDVEFTAVVTNEAGEVADDVAVWEISDNENDTITIPNGDPTQAIVGNTAKLHGASLGSATITVYPQTKPDMKTSFKIEVVKSCNKIEIKNEMNEVVTNKFVSVGNTLPLHADLTINDPNNPYNHGDEVFGWTSSNPDVADVDDNGVVTAKKNGKATITVTTLSAQKRSADITVFTTSSIYLVKGVTKPENEGDLPTAVIALDNKLEGQLKVEAAVYDQNETLVNNPTCNWSSSDTSVATVNANGLVKGVNVGTATITVTSGAKSQSFELTITAPIAAMATDPTTIPDFVYSPLVRSYEPEVSVKVGTNRLSENVHYRVEYTNNDKVGTASMKFIGLGYYIGEKAMTFKINKRPLTDSTISVDYIEDQECTGIAVEPILTITCNGYVLTNGIDYTVAYKNNVKPGMATMTIKGKGNYSEELEKTFNIVCSHKTLKGSTVLKRPTYNDTGLEVGTCTACGETNVSKVIPMLEHTSNPALSISFPKEVYGISQGEELQLNLNATSMDPLTPPTDVFRWVSDNPRIVSVTDTGIIKGLTKGKTIITAYGENESAVASCEVGVIDKAESITVAPSPAETRINVSTELIAELYPAKNDDEIVWEIGNTGIATLTPSPTNKKGVIVTGVSVGTTTITAKAKYSDLTAEIPLTVGERNESDIIAVFAVIDETPTPIPNSTLTTVYTHKMYTNQDVVFNAVLTDVSGNPSDDVAVWQISNNDGDTITLPNNDPNEDVVNNQIKIHAASLGKVTVTVFPQNRPDLKTTFDIEVTKRCNNISIKDEFEQVVVNKSMNVDDRVSFHADLTTNDPNHPYDHGDEVFSWTSSDPEVVQIDSYGNVVAKKNGTATITMTTLSEQKKTVGISVFTTSSVYLTSGVEKPQNEGDIPTAEIKLNDKFQGTKKIGITVYDQNEVPVSNVTCKWSSSNDNIAEVNEKGEVTAKNVGTALITVQSGSKSESFMLTITAPMTALVCEPDSIPNFVYSPDVEEYIAEPVLKMGPDTLVKDVDYTAEYIDNTKVGTATMRVTGMGYYTGSADIHYTISAKNLADDDVIVSAIGEQNYTGKPITPEFTVTYKGTELVMGKDYAVQYNDNKDEGTATIVIKAVNKGNYTGTKTIEFAIVKNGTLGDVDGDGQVTSSDALTILRASVGLSELDESVKPFADVNGDTQVDSNDAITVLRFSTGIIDSL